MNFEETLPNYAKYMRKLRKFAKGLNLHIQVRNFDSLGQFSSKLSRITLDSDNTEAENVAALLHELGHAIDDLFIHTYHRPKLDRAYNRMYRSVKKVTKYDRRVILRCEHQAWNAAEDIATQLDITLGKWFFDCKKRCLEGYRDA